MFCMVLFKSKADMEWRANRVKSAKDEGVSFMSIP